MIVYNLGRGAVARTARVMRASHRTGFILPNGVRIKRSRDYFLSMEDTTKMADAILSGMRGGFIGVKDDNGHPVDIEVFKRFANWASEEPEHDPMDLDNDPNPEEDDAALLDENSDEELGTSIPDLDDDILLDTEESGEDVGDNDVLEDEGLEDNEVLEDVAGEHPAEFLDEEMLQKMSRADLNAMAEDHSLDPEDYKNKTAIVNALLTLVGE